MRPSKRGPGNSLRTLQFSRLVHETLKLERYGWPLGDPRIKTLLDQNLSVTLTQKLVLYTKSVAASRSANLAGFPLIPKVIWPSVPYSRNAYNSFISWINLLGLSSIGTVLDVGANHGDFARAANALFPRAKAFLFEPLPELQGYLRSVASRQGLAWKVLPFALGAEAGEFPLYLDDGDDSVGSLAGFTEEYRQVNPTLGTGREVKCEVRTLDAVVKEEGISRIDLLKIDVEGFEFEVLEGAATALERTTAVIIEVSLIRRHSGVRHPLLGMLELLTSRGFNVVEVMPSLYGADAPWRPAEFNLLVRRPDKTAPQARE